MSADRHSESFQEEESHSLEAAAHLNATLFAEYGTSDALEILMSDLDSDETTADRVESAIEFFLADPQEAGKYDRRAADYLMVRTIIDGAEDSDISTELIQLRQVLRK